MDNDLEKNEETFDLEVIENNFDEVPEFKMEIAHFDEKEQEDKEWKERTGLNNDTLCGAIETIIFLTEKPIDIQKIRQTIDATLPLRVIHDAILRLQEEYEKPHHGLRLQEVAEGYQFRTKASYAKFVQEIFKVNSINLSPTALEVLAIIAYKQPISRADIDKIRGVDSSHIVKSLMDKRLVRITGRSEDLGSPVVYVTRLEFLEVFNLKSLDELPPEYELENMANSNTVGQIKDIKEIVNSTSKSFHFDDTEELESLADTIKSIVSDTDFTKSLALETEKKISNNQEKIPSKTAFELLEEFIHLDKIKEINEKSFASETLTSVMDAKVIDLENSEGILNAPETEESFEELKTEEEEIFTFSQNLQNQEETYEEEQILDEVTEHLDEINKEAVEEAKKLDIDLEFLNNYDADDDMIQ